MTDDPAAACWDGAPLAAAAVAVVGTGAALLAAAATTGREKRTGAGRSPPTR